MKTEIKFGDTRIYPCLVPEKKALNFKRSECKISTKDKITFKINAADKTALKAATFSVNNLIAVYEKTKRVVENG